MLDRDEKHSLTPRRVLCVFDGVGQSARRSSAGCKEGDASETDLHPGMGLIPEGETSWTAASESLEGLFVLPLLSFLGWSKGPVALTNAWDLVVYPSV